MWGRLTLTPGDTLVTAWTNKIQGKWCCGISKLGHKRQYGFYWLSWVLFLDFQPPCCEEAQSARRGHMGIPAKSRKPVWTATPTSVFVLFFIWWLDSPVYVSADGPCYCFECPSGDSRHHGAETRHPVWIPDPQEVREVIKSYYFKRLNVRGIC